MTTDDVDTDPPPPGRHSGRHRHAARSTRRRVLIALLLAVSGTALGMLGVVVLPALLHPRTVEIPLENGSFEHGEETTPAGWRTYSPNGNETAAYTQKGGFVGAYRLSHWRRQAYQVQTYMYLPRVESGNYTLTVWVNSSGGQLASYIALHDCGPADEPRTVVPPGGVWRQISVSGKVTAGRCTLTLASQGSGGTWTNFDDVRLVRTSGLRDDARAPALVGILATMLAFSLVGGSILVRRRALRPLTVLTRAVRRLGAGHRWEQVEVHGNDNVAELTETFNSMAAALLRDDERQRRLVADVAHELRTPLSTVRSYLEALIDGVLPADPDVFVSLHDEALLQQRIIDDLQDLALADAGALTYHKAAVNLPDLLRTCRTALNVKAEKADVRLTVQATDPETIVLADTDRLRQVINNLVGNALRYTPADGEISLGCETSGREAVVTVTDTGSGIAPEHLPHVFDRFWRADRSRGRGSGGSGLGLAIARRIILDHDGDITVHSRIGHGTTFALRLPLSTADAPTAHDATTRDRPGPREEVGR